MQELPTDLPFVLWFSASWCAPCKVMYPIIEKAAEDYKGRVRFIKVDVDSDPESSKIYDIRSVPTFMLFNSEGRVGVHLGGMSRIALDQFVAKVLE